MMINEGEDDGFSAYLPVRKEATTRREDVWKVNQQPTGQGLILPVGVTVRYFDKNKMKLCNVIYNKATMENGYQASKVIIMNIKEEISVRHNSIIPFNDPEPSDILQYSENTNRKFIS